MGYETVLARRCPLDGRTCFLDFYPTGESVNERVCPTLASKYDYNNSEHQECPMVKGITKACEAIGVKWYFHLGNYFPLVLVTDLTPVASRNRIDSKELSQYLFRYVPACAYMPGIDWLLPESTET